MVRWMINIDSSTIQKFLKFYQSLGSGSPWPLRFALYFIKTRECFVVRKIVYEPDKQMHYYCITGAIVSMRSIYTIFCMTELIKVRWVWYKAWSMGLPVMVGCTSRQLCLTRLTIVN